MSKDELIVTIDGGLATVTLNRPNARNALSKSLKERIAASFGSLGQDRSVKAIILTGAGDRAFCAGSDIKEMSKFNSGAAEAMLQVEHAFFDSVLRCPKPVVAAVGGYALGAGCQLAMCADVCIAMSGARFGMPELRFGAVNGNETALFMYFGGLGLSRRLIMGCEVLTAQEAKSWGIVTEIVETSEDLISRAANVAKCLGDYPGAAYARQKRLLLSWLDQSYSSAVESSIADAALAWDDPDVQAAMAQALDKAKN